MATTARQSSLLERAQSGATQNRLVWGLLAIATVLTVRSIITQVRHNAHDTVQSLYLLLRVQVLTCLSRSAVRRCPATAALTGESLQL